MASPPLPAMDVLTPSEESVKLTNWFTKEMSFLLLSCISVSCISDSQEVRRKERIFSKAGESECPAVQILPLGTAPHAPVNHYKYPRVVREGGSVLCAGAGERADSCVLHGAGGSRSRVMRE